MAETPMLSAFIGDVTGQTAYMQWSPVSTTFSDVVKLIT